MYKEASKAVQKYPHFVPDRRGPAESRYEVHIYSLRHMRGRERIRLQVIGVNERVRARAKLKADGRMTASYAELYQRREKLECVERRGDETLKTRYEEQCAGDMRFEQAVRACEESQRQQ